LDFGLTTTDLGIQHVNAYTYANINLFRNVTMTAGASFDYLKGRPANIPSGDKDQFNPKAGITWNPFVGTVLRAAVSRILKRSLITDQTLEPTQVAGFNQFFLTLGEQKLGAMEQR
jgi:outer membrane receptor protein involved in Fe transport